MERENGEQAWVHDRAGTTMRDKETLLQREEQTSSERREGETTETKMRDKYECVTPQLIHTELHP